MNRWVFKKKPNYSLNKPKKNAEKKNLRIKVGTIKSRKACPSISSRYARPYEHGVQRVDWERGAGRMGYREASLTVIASAQSKHKKIATWPLPCSEQIFFNKGFA